MPSPPPKTKHSASDLRSMNVARRSPPRSPVSNARPSATSRPSSKAGSPPERCEQRVERLNTRLDDLRAQQAELADDGADEAAHAPTAADLAATADQLEGVIANSEPEQAKALLRILIAELRVNSKTDIQPTYRVLAPDRLLTAGVCATSEKVETVGTEPTFGLPPCRLM
jgi:hypothetical protein